MLTASELQSSVAMCLPPHVIVCGGSPGVKRAAPANSRQSLQLADSCRGFGVQHHIDASHHRRVTLAIQQTCAASIT